MVLLCFRIFCSFFLNMTKDFLDLQSVISNLNNLVFPFFHLSNFLKYWSSVLTNTGMSCLPVSIWK